MSKVEFIFKFIRNFFWMVLLDGIMAILAGILIIIYPDLLGILVGMVLVLMGIASVVFAFKIRKFIKLEIEV